MKWLKIEIDINRNIQEEVFSYLMDRGAGGIQITDPDEVMEYISSLDTYEYASLDLMPQNIQGDLRITCYLTPNGDINSIVKNMKAEFSIDVNNIIISELIDEDCADNWKKYYTEFDIGDKITIRPAWESDPYKEGRIVILMDPKMAFGSGEHETTYMCLELLDEINLLGSRVLDVGTGSGILAIAAAKLGAARLTAIDIDQIAVVTTAENAIINKTEDRICVSREEISQVDETGFDLVTANIVADVLIDICGELKKRMKAGGVVIISGIIEDKQEKVKKEFLEKGFFFVREKRKKEWLAMVFNA